VDWVSWRQVLGRPRGPLGIRLGDVGMTVVVLIAVELSMDVEPEELLQAVRVVARGDALLAPSVTRSLIAYAHGLATPSA
jgi:hypothetical protein